MCLNSGPMLLQCHTLDPAREASDLSNPLTCHKENYKLGLIFGAQSWGPKGGVQILVSNVAQIGGPRLSILCPRLDPDFDPQMWGPNVDPKLGPPNSGANFGSLGPLASWAFWVLGPMDPLGLLWGQGPNSSCGSAGSMVLGPCLEGSPDGYPHACSAVEVSSAGHTSGGGHWNMERASPAAHDPMRSTWVAEFQAKDPRFQGSRVPRFQVSKVPRYQCTKLPRFQGSKVPGFQSTNIPRLEGSQVPAFQGSQFKVPRFQGSILDPVQHSGFWTRSKHIVFWFWTEAICWLLGPRVGTKQAWGHPGWNSSDPVGIQGRN